MSVSVNGTGAVGGTSSGMMICGTSSGGICTTRVVETNVSTAPLKNEIKVGMLVKVLKAAGKHEGMVAYVRDTFCDDVFLNGCSGAFPFQFLQVVEIPKDPVALVGDFVHAIDLGAPVLGRIINVVTTHTYTIEDTHGHVRTCCKVLPATAEEREVLTTKRRNELLKIAADAMQELARIDRSCEKAQT